LKVLRFVRRQLVEPQQAALPCATVSVVTPLTGLAVTSAVPVL
jgi:hypothetical protein